MSEQDRERVFKKQLSPSEIQDFLDGAMTRLDLVEQLGRDKTPLFGGVLSGAMLKDAVERHERRLANLIDDVRDRIDPVLSTQAGYLDDLGQSAAEQKARLDRFERRQTEVFQRIDIAETAIAEMRTAPGNHELKKLLESTQGDLDGTVTRLLKLSSRVVDLEKRNEDATVPEETPEKVAVEDGRHFLPIDTKLIAKMLFDPSSTREMIKEVALDYLGVYQEKQPWPDTPTEVHPPNRDGSKGGPR